MTFTLKKTNTVTRPVPLVQYDEEGREIASRLNVRFKMMPREEWDKLTQAPDDDERLLFDVVVDGIADTVKNESGETMSPEAALAAIRADMSLTGQIVGFYTQFAFGAAAKNAQRSRAR